ncbi:plant protein [Musa troglodytarum]|uniref:Plant protein n=1 Tax=Musa troglodytarum TaxID=320322 RepID=A0A9E7HXR7_9LILI|nr:plant protein [Musa troglodytarum]
MDRRSWLWRRKSSEKSPGETESSTSVSSHSERYSDGLELSRASPNDASVSHAQSREVLCNTSDGEVHEIVKRLTEKLSVALLNTSAKEDLVKQHAKVAEEAVSGWEQAEAEVAALKQQLQTTLQKNSVLEDKISRLDGALKECVRQLHQSREEQEEKVRYSMSEKTQMWGSEKRALEKQIVELTAQLEAAKTKAGTFDHGSRARLEAVEKENMALKTELRSQSEDLQVLLLERELSNTAAETASKQHLESIRKVTKLEAECSRLQITNRRLSSASDHKPISSSACVESLTDSRSDSGERSLGMDNGPARSDSWASALIAELDQFKSEKADSRILSRCPVEIELMDDFLEMEKLVALPETDPANSDLEPEADSSQLVRRENPPNVDGEFMHHTLIELEEKVERLEHEKAELEIASTESHNRLEASRGLVTAAESKVVELQTKLDMENESKQTAMSEFTDSEGKRKELETRLESAYLENGKLREKVSLLEESSKSERALSFELKATIDNTEAAREALNSQLESARSQISSLNETIGVLEQQAKEERALSSSELASKAKALESQLEHAHSEASKLQEKVNFWEPKAEEETKLSAEIAVKLEATEAARKKLELELGSAHEFAAKAEAIEAARRALEIQLGSALRETGKLSDKVALFEARIDEERALSAEFAAKCHKLEADLSKKIEQEADLRRAANSNPELKIKQEKELAVAAGKLEECRKTIASLNRQLKSLADLDGFMLEAEKLEQDGDDSSPSSLPSVCFHLHPRVCPGL